MLTLVVIPSTTNDVIQDDSDTINEALKSYQSTYSWNHIFKNGSLRGTTLIWDKLQESGECCGLDNWADWDAYRPQALSTNYYPGSCCRIETERDKSNLYCTDSEALYSIGCREIVVSAIRSIIVILSTSIIIFFLIAAFIGS